MKTQIPATNLTNSLYAASKEASIPGVFYFVLFIAIILAIALMMVLVWGNRDKTPKVPMEDFLGELKRKMPSAPAVQKSFLQFNNCLYQEAEYSGYDMTLMNPEIEVADGRTLHYKLLESRMQYSIGRGDNDIEIVNDMGISRQHATLEKIPGNGYKIRLCAQNTLYLCNERFEILKEIKEHTFQSETIYLILGDPRCGFKLSVRDLTPKLKMESKSAGNVGVTQSVNSKRERWQV